MNSSPVLRAAWAAVVLSSLGVPDDEIPLAVGASGSAIEGRRGPWPRVTSRRSWSCVADLPGLASVAAGHLCLGTPVRRPVPSIFCGAHVVRSPAHTSPGTSAFRRHDPPRSDTAGRSNPRGNSRSSLPRPAAPNLESHSGSCMAREGIEPPTRGFSVRCSTN